MTRRKDKPAQQKDAPVPPVPKVTKKTIVKEPKSAVGKPLKIETTVQTVMRENLPRLEAEIADLRASPVKVENR